MKKIFFLCSVLFAMHAQAQLQGDTIISANEENLKVKLLYFHITHRCNTCLSIEANIRKTIEQHFSSELETGVLALYIMNCELPENQELVKKYDAYGATLALTSYTAGRENKTDDITGWAFQKAGNAEKFIAELKSKIEEHLK